MHVAVVGAGAIGTWLGAALTRDDHDVALVARGRHLDAMRRDGVRIHAPDGAYTVRPLATADARDVGPVDAVLLAVKAHDQAGAGAAVGALLGPQTPIVAVQNGIPWWYFHGLGGRWAGRRIEAVDPGGAVSAVLPPGRAIGLVVYLGARVAAPGVVDVRPEAGLVIGEPDGSASARLEAVAGALEGAGFPVRRTPHIRAEIWTKLMGNAAFNPISVLTGAGLGTMARDPGVREVAARVMAEVVEVAGALGAAPAMAIEDRLALTARLGDHRTSTLQDLEAGRRLELDALTGAVVELADLTGVAAPALRTVHALAALVSARGASPAARPSGA
jgi:2-dehydropantoate 2-reductase